MPLCSLGLGIQQRWAGKSESSARRNICQPYEQPLIPPPSRHPWRFLGPAVALDGPPRHTILLLLLLLLLLPGFGTEYNEFWNWVLIPGSCYKSLYTAHARLYLELSTVNNFLLCGGDCLYHISDLCLSMKHTEHNEQTNEPTNKLS